MPLFEYEAVDRNSIIKTGQIEADTQVVVSDQLKNQGLMVIEIKRVKKAYKNSFFTMSFSSSDKVKPATMAMFCRQVATMLGAGISVVKALSTLSSQIPHRGMRKILASVTESVEAGASISDSFSEFPKVFSEVFVAMIKAGEMTGNLEEVFEKMALQTQKEKVLKDSVKSAATYPLFIFGVSIITFFLIMIFVVPKFIDMIPSSIELPLVSKIVFALSTSMRVDWYFWLLGLLVTGALVYSFIKSSYTEAIWDKLRFKIPLIGKFIRQYIVARTCRILSSLLNGGIPIVQALETSAPVSGSVLVRNAINEAADRILEGQTIAEPLEKSGIFPPMMITMVHTGEETGQLPMLLENLANFYEEEVEIKSKGLISIIEPVMIFLIAIFIGIVLIAIYIPIFEYATSM